MARITNAQTTLAEALAGISRHPTRQPRVKARVRRVPVYCGVCGGRIDMTLKAPHPGSHSIDHRVPQSWGGTNALTNLQAAHLGCNQSKGNRPTLAELLGG